MFLRLGYAAILAAAACTVFAETPKKPDSPREMFRDLGVDDSYFDRLADGQPLEAGERETLLRSPLSPPHFSGGRYGSLGRGWRQAGRSGSAAGEVAATIFRLRGRVTEVEPIAPAEESPNDTS